jgi:ceramide glucosyltransferase
MTGAAIAGAFCAAVAFLNFVSVLIAIVRLRRNRRASLSGSADPVTIVRPVCGLDAFIEETLASGFALNYPSYELIFCVAQANDPAVPLIGRLMRAHPAVPARLLIGDERISANPKLNNCIRGWNAARHDWVILADSNVLMPRDYIQRLLSRWRPDTGLVCSTPIGTRPIGFWAELECAFLNTLQARWQYVGESLGLGFAQGKSMLWRRDFLESRGGIRALAAEIAEDAAATKLVRSAGLRVHLVQSPFEQPLGRRRAGDVWNRQVRWARLRRVTFPEFFALEIFTSIALPLAAGVYAAVAGGYATLPIVGGLVVLWYGAEAVLAFCAGWPVSARLLAAFLLRDSLILPLWLFGWISTNVTWRGNAMSIRTKKLATLRSPPSAF